MMLLKNLSESCQQVKMRLPSLKDDENLQLARAFTFVSEGVVITDPHQVDNPIVYVNPAFTSMTGYEAVEVLGQNCRFLQGAGTNSQVIADIRAAIAQRQEIRTTILNYRKNGQPFWNELKISPVFSEEGELIYFVGIQADITERKQAEIALQNQSRLSKLQAEIGVALGQGGGLTDSLQHCMKAMVKHLEIVQASLWTLNADRDRLELQATSGTSTEEKNELLTASYLPLKDNKIATVAQSQKATILRTKEWSISENHEFLAVSPLVVEGRLVGVIALGSSQAFSEAVQEVLGWIAGAIALAIDRSWTKEELNLRREGILFQLASQIRNSLDLDTILGTAVKEIHNLLQVDLCQYVWCWDSPSTPMVAVSHQSGNATLAPWLEKANPKQVIPLARKILNHEMLRVDNLAQTQNLDEESKTLLSQYGINSQLLLPLQTRSGQQGAILCSHTQGHPWSDREVGLLQAVVDQLAIAIDQAELFAQTRAAALAAQTQAKQLQQTIQELKSAESRLIQSEKMSSLGQMVAGIAHEINNPVNFITGNLTHTSNYIEDLLALIALYQEHDPNPVPKIEEFCEEIDIEFLMEDLPKTLASMRMGADRIRNIVVSLRNFSRLDEAEMKPVNIHEGIDSTLLILQSRLKAKGNSSEIQIVKNYADLPKVECYAGQLNQIFMNLIGNAIDALEDQPDPKIITITTELSETPCPGFRNASAIIRIADNGAGIPEKIQKQLFDPFFTTKPPGKGTGLGLAISYQIAEKHGGILKCESEEGKGAEFSIQIPLQQTDAHC